MNTTDSRYLRINELLEMLPMGKSTIWRKVKDGTFPRPVKLGVRITAWKHSEILEFIASKEQERG